MNEQGPWIPSGSEENDPGRGSSELGSYGGDGFRGGPPRSPGSRGSGGPGGARGPSGPIRPVRRLLIPALILLLALISGTVALVVIRSRSTGWPPPDWIFAACDVGQGDALALAVGPAEAVVVDTGPDPAKADHCLTTLGIRKIPLIVLTHFHADHIDGVPGVLKGRAVAELETTNDPDPPKGAAEVAAWASAAGIRTSVASAGEHRQFGPVSWDVLWPDPNASPPPTPPAEPGHKSRRRGRHQARASPNTDSGTSSSSSSSSSSGSTRSGGEEGSGPNNSSVVLQVTVATRDGPVRLLLTGDIEPPSQAAILAAHPDLAADLLKVPHHGSKYQDPDFIGAVRPRVSIISVGSGNLYGHPSPDTVRLAGGSAGAPVLRTDRDGEIVVYGSARNLRAALRR